MEQHTNELTDADETDVMKEIGEMRNRQRELLKPQPVADIKLDLKKLR